MYVDSCTLKRKDKQYTRHLLRSSFREGKKVKHKTLANLSGCSDAEIEAIRLALKHKGDLTALASAKDVTLSQGRSVAAVWLLLKRAEALGLRSALGDSRQGRLALWQVLARVIDQGSRLSAVRLADGHAACDLLGLDKFNEDSLYRNLDWIDEERRVIEQRLFRSAHPQGPPSLYLYDVTSSYLEGTDNELGEFGYNRDKKAGKRQIVIGLLCDGQGRPLSCEVFAGNTQDPKTMAKQIEKVAERFGAKGVTFVGDRGMIKADQVKDLKKKEFHYITAITKPQIRKLLKDGVIQMSLFDEDLAEVDGPGDVRLLLRRNPQRAKETRQSREKRLKFMQGKVDERNEYLAGHPRAKPETAMRRLKKRRAKLNLTSMVSFSRRGRKFKMTVDAEAVAKRAMLDGCYVLKTDLSRKAADKKTVHARYRDLALVETAFRTQKTAQLEVRPVFLRLANRTRAHVFVVMMAYLLVRDLKELWKDLDVKVQEGVNELSTLCSTSMKIRGKARCHSIPRPRRRLRQLLKAAGVELPEALPMQGVAVATRNKLQKRRLKR